MEAIPTLRRHGDEIKDAVSDTYHRLFEQLHGGDPATMTVLYVYINILQETREIASSLRKYLRAFAKLHDSEFRSRNTPALSPKSKIQSDFAPRGNCLIIAMARRTRDS